MFMSRVKTLSALEFQLNFKKKNKSVQQYKSARVIALTGSAQRKIAEELHRVSGPCWN